MPTRCASFSRKIRHLAVARPQVSAPVRKAPCHQLCHQRSNGLPAGYGRSVADSRGYLKAGSARSAATDKCRVCVHRCGERSPARKGPASVAGRAPDCSPGRPRLAGGPVPLRRFGSVSAPKGEAASPGPRRFSRPLINVRRCSLTHVPDTFASSVRAESPRPAWRRRKRRPWGRT